MRSEISGSKFRAIKCEHKKYTNLHYYTYFTENSTNISMDRKKNT